MKIALLSPFAASLGGVSTYAVQLSGAYRRHGHETLVLSPDLPLGDPGRLPAGRLSRWLSLLIKLQKFKPDIVHINSQVNMVLPVLAYRLVNRNAKLIFAFLTQPQPFIPPGLEHARAARPSYAGMRKIIAQYLLSKCTVVTAVADSLFSNLERTGGMRFPRRKTVPCAMEFTQQPDAKQCKELFGVAGCAPVLSTIGNLAWDWKVAGHKMCIEAMPGIIAEYPNAVLLVVGGGKSEYADYLAAIVKNLGLGKNVFLVGPVSGTAQVLAASDVYLHMAAYEASPLSLLEAMSFEKPVVGVNAGGVPESINHNVTGILVPPDPGALTQAVLELLRKPEMAKTLGKNASEYVRKERNWDMVVKQFISAVQ